MYTGFVSEAEKSEALNLDALTLFELEGEGGVGSLSCCSKEFDYRTIVCSQKLPRIEDSTGYYPWFFHEMVGADFVKLDDFCMPFGLLLDDFWVTFG